MRLAPDDALMVNDAAWGFMTAGDLSPSDSRCRFYDKAKATFNRQEHLLVADQYMIRGESFSMEPLRKAHEKLVIELARKMVEARCS